QVVWGFREYETLQKQASAALLPFAGEGGTSAAPSLNTSRHHNVASSRVFTTSSATEALFGRRSRKATLSAIVIGAIRLGPGVTPGMPAVKSVSTAPGHSAVTRTPSS